MQLHELKPTAGSQKKRMRVGRGNGSGKGTYAGRGMNGQSSRSGGRRRPGFEGGQTPLHRRMPKLGGFKNPRRIEYAPINVSTLEKRFQAGDTVDRASLAEKRIIKSENLAVKVLGNGEITIALTVKVDKISKSAAEKIIKAKGKVE
ncbi:MAG: 50S ribosomal protein L15 [Candidatus Peregrinibacteria bacterium]|nr:50S ribosomal protein L15 [Candidatus Peregrinibacteria bacterium]